MTVERATGQSHQVTLPTRLRVPLKLLLLRCQDRDRDVAEVWTVHAGRSTVRHYTVLVTRRDGTPLDRTQLLAQVSH